MSFAQTENLPCEIVSVLERIVPCDDVEAGHRTDVLAWVRSGAPLFRIQKPNIPERHLVSYFCLCDFELKKV
jgi:8-oxo-dGTP diphosphatase